MSEDLRKGDTVQLKGGSPIMTVNHIWEDGNSVVVIWFVDGEEKSGTYSIEALKKINRNFLV